jgi:hypothetical protein
LLPLFVTSANRRVSWHLHFSGIGSYQIAPSLKQAQGGLTAGKFVALPLIPQQKKVRIITKRQQTAQNQLAEPAHVLACQEMFAQRKMAAD